MNLSINMDIKTLNKIKHYAKNEYNQAKDKYHDFDHIERVVKNALGITDRLKFSEGFDKNLLLAACYLHDIVITKRNNSNFLKKFYNHIFEKLLNKKYIRKILKNFSLPLNEEQILALTIINHPHSIPYHSLNRHNDLYSKILQDADSLDYISLERTRNFIYGKRKILIYFFNIYLTWIRKNIRHFLNIQESLDQLKSI